MYLKKQTTKTFTYNTGGFSFFWEVAFFYWLVPEQKSETWVLIETLAHICYVALYFGLVRDYVLIT